VDTPVAEDTLLGGRYRVRSLLGSGGMAQVYDGLDERLARPVAIKLLRSDLAAQVGLRERFELEARAAARLAHPNVVAVFDAGDDQGHSYIVMERLRGESLADAIGRGPLDQTWLRRLAGEILSALTAAHQAGIIHRDIKPANILLGSEGQAKVADFGIARVAEAQAAEAQAATAAALTGTGLILGTPAYLAPERAMGMPATPQSDLYSVGVVLYEALTGKKPFGGPTPVAIVAAAVHGAAENPYLARPEADAHLVAVIARAMAVDPAQRYATAAEMASDLRRETPPATAIMAAGSGAGGAAAAALAGAGAAGAALAGAGAGAGVAAAALAGAGAGVAGAALAGGAHGGAAAAPTVPLDRGGRPTPPAFAPPPGPRWPGRLRSRPGLVALGAVAVVAIILAVVISSSGGSPRASSTTSTTSATTAPPTTATTTATTTAPGVVVAPSDATATALRFYADHLSGSSSEAASPLATALNAVANTDPARRAAAAAAVLSQAVQWLQDGKLSSAEYVTAAALLHNAGAPQPPPPTATTKKKKGGGGGGD
jgi:eukaryotic-like serine/threonine-protein kinase